MKRRKVVRIGSRGSALALFQAREVVERLSRMYPEIRWEVVPIQTSGDRWKEDSWMVLSKRIFVKEIEEALLERTIDLAVHSLKDLPVDLPPGLTLFAVLEREDPREAFLSRSGMGFWALPEGATIGTSSVRRKVQLEALRPDLQVVSLRGNVPTRLRKMEAGQVEALVLAAAGLKRLGEEKRVVEFFPPEMFVPAVGQGAIGVEGRIGDPLQEMVAAIHHVGTAQAVEAEREFLQFFGGGCRIPIGALATVENGEMKLLGMAAWDGVVRKAFREGPVRERSRIAQLLAQLLRGEAGG